MKISILTNLYPPYVRGGAERIAFMQAKTFSELGHDVSVLTSCPFKNVFSLYARPDDESGIQVYRFFPLNMYHTLQDHKYPQALRFIWHGLDMFHEHAYFTTLGFLNNTRPDLILTHNLKGMGLSVALAIRAYRRKSHAQWFHTLHDVQLVHPSGIMLAAKKHTSNLSFWEAQYAMVCRSFFNNPDIILSPSQFLIDFYKGYSFWPKSTQVKMLNPVKSMKYDGMKKSLVDPRSFLYLGQLEEHKGIIELIDQLQGRLEPFVLHIAGKGSFVSQVQKKIDGDYRFVYHGYIGHDEAQKLWPKIDFMIFPSMCYENSPSVIYESFFAGVPVVSVNHGGAQELLVNQTQLLYDVTDPQSFDEVMRYAFKMEINEYNDIVQKNYKSIQQNNPVSYTERILSLYSGGKL